MRRCMGNCRRRNRSRPFAPRHQAIASKLVKEIAVLGGDVTKFVSPSVKDRLLAKVGRA